MRNFRDLEIWKEAIEIAVDIYKITKTFPSEEKFGLVSQMNRSVVSISSNIAEGCRGTEKEFVYFLQIAIGSSFELESQIILCQKVKLISEKDSMSCQQKLNSIQKKINSFRTVVKKRIK